MKTHRRRSLTALLSPLHRRALVATASAVLLSSGVLLPPSASGRLVRHSAADCEAACQDRNIGASCDWLSPVPRRCRRQALKACEANPVAGPAACLPPKDLPACGSHHGCPYGALCIDSTCQVLGCGSHNGVADCTGTNRCDGDKCVVAECSAVTANCPRGFHCEPASPPFDGISGACLPDVPGVGYCSVNTDCIEQGNFNPTCMQGICTRQVRRLGSCQNDADCSRWCRRGRGAMRPGRCGAAGACLCTSCADDAQCGQLLPCGQGRVSTCLPSGTCVCRKLPRSRATTTTTTTTTDSTTTDTSATSTTTTLPPNICCCTFQTSDNLWHCVNASQPSPWLCAVPWPDCCSQAYTVCQ